MLNEFWWTLSFVANTLTIFLFVIYLWPSIALSFQRTKSLTQDDFSLLTNDYTSAKYFFIVLFPNLFLPLVFTTFYMRLIVLRFYNDVFEASTVEKSRDEREVKDKKTEFLNILKWLHLVITIISLIFFIIALSFIINEYSTCNENSGNLCNSLEYCCASDVLISPPGITPNCPYIYSCTGLDPFTKASLKPDPYFVWIFWSTGTIILFLIVHFLLGWIVDYTFVNDEDDIKDEINMMPINNSDISNSTPIGKKFGIFPTVFIPTSMLNMKKR